MEIVLILVGIAVPIVLIVASVAWLNARRRLQLLARYGDDAVVEMIMGKKIWEGMTLEQLIASWGRPAEIDERVLKTKTSHVYKYGRSGRATFRAKVKLDDGIVVGWEQRGQS